MLVDNERFHVSSVLDIPLVLKGAVASSETMLRTMDALILCATSSAVQAGEDRNVIKLRGVKHILCLEKEVRKTIRMAKKKIQVGTDRSEPQVRPKPVETLISHCASYGKMLGSMK